MRERFKILLYYTIGWTGVLGALLGPLLAAGWLIKSVFPFWWQTADNYELARAVGLLSILIWASTIVPLYGRILQLEERLETWLKK